MCKIKLVSKFKIWPLKCTHLLSRKYIRKHMNWSKIIFNDKRMLFFYFSCNIHSYYNDIQKENEVFSIHQQDTGSVTFFGFLLLKKKTYNCYCRRGNKIVMRIFRYLNATVEHGERYFLSPFYTFTQYNDYVYITKDIKNGLKISFPHFID